jgi:hypothetical protein
MNHRAATMGIKQDIEGLMEMIVLCKVRGQMHQSVCVDSEISSFNRQVEIDYLCRRAVRHHQTNKATVKGHTFSGRTLGKRAEYLIQLCNVQNSLRVARPNVVSSKDLQAICHPRPG